MTDIQEIYSILLARGYQDQVFSDLPGKRKREKGGRETLVDCPYCKKDNHFSYNRERPVWRCLACNESGDWIDHMERQRGYSFQQALAELAGQAGVEISPHIQEGYKAYVRKADILEEAQSYFSETLDQTGSQVFDYLTGRGYSAEEIYGMELGEYKDRKALQDHLKKAGYTDQEIKDSGLLTQGFGETHSLTLLWRDQAGRAIGMAGRATTPEVEPKYKYSAGLQKDKGLVGFSSVRGSPAVTVVEGVLDALLLNHKGIKAVSLGGTSISTDQLKALETAGTQELLLALDMDQPGQKATEKMIRDLKTSRLRAYVVSLPEGYKDPDELIRAQGVEVFQRVMRSAERSSSWMAKRIASRHDTETARGMDQALEEAGVYLSDIKDSLETKDFLDSLQQATGISGEDLDSRLQEVSRTASEIRAQSILVNNLRDIQQKASQGDITGAEADISSLLSQVKLTRGVRLPEPYLMEDLAGDLKTTTPALSSGYTWLDRIAQIPVGALTIVGGRPGHGKTTLQLNILIRMLRAYPYKRFFFFSYEEARKALATKIIMILAGVELQRETNYGAYVHYIKEKQGTNKKIDDALQEYEDITSAGRLLVSDDMYRAEDLAVVLEALGREGETGAVFIDYLQKIPVQRPQSQRYMDIKLISELMLKQAVSQDIPIILGAQLSRASGGGAEPTLADLREGGDIEQDANLVLSLYTQAIDELQEKTSGQRGKSAKVETKVSVLKNRGGEAGHYQKMDFNMPIYTITEKEI